MAPPERGFAFGAEFKRFNRQIQPRITLHSIALRRYAHVMTKCKRCRRKLTDPKSIARGYGRTCAAKVAASVAASVAPFKASQVDNALTLIADGAIEPAGDNGYIVIGRSGTYSTHATGCTCRGAQYGRVCYHLIAANVLDAVAAA